MKIPTRNSFNHENNDAWLCEQLRAGEMALLRYLQCKDGLPDPKGSLSSTLPPKAIARANQEVQAATEKKVQVREKGKRGAYYQYSPGECADIGRYASQHGVAAAARFFSRKLKSTVHTQTHRALHNPPFSQPNVCKVSLVKYFRGWPRSRKYSRTKSFHTKISQTTVCTLLTVSLCCECKYVSPSYIMVGVL